MRFLMLAVLAGGGAGTTGCAARSATLSGRVIAAADGAAIAGATVRFSGSGATTTTRADGSFRLPLPGAESLDSIIVSHDGFLPFASPELPLHSRSDIQFSAMLNKADAVPAFHAECAFGGISRRICDAPQVPPGGFMILFNGGLGIAGSGLSHPMQETAAKLIGGGLTRIDVIAGKSAEELFGARAWYGLIVARTEACPLRDSTRVWECR